MTRGLRIAMVALDFHREGGSENRTGHLVDALQRAGHEVHLIGARIRGAWGPAVRRHPIPALPRPRWIAVLQFSRRAAALVERERFDLVHSLMTLHHIDDTDALLQSLYALLKSPGTLCLADLASEDGSFHGADFSGHKGFDRQALQATAAQAGFRNIRLATVFTIRKAVATGGEKDFPVFLMVAEKP